MILTIVICAIAYYLTGSGGLVVFLVWLSMAISTIKKASKPKIPDLNIEETPEKPKE